MIVRQLSLFGSGEPGIDLDTSFERIALDARSWVDVAFGWLRGADTLLDLLIEHVDWHQGRRWMYDREVDDPRLSRWFEPGEPLPHPVLAQACLALEARYGQSLRGPALNYYRDGRDSVAFHRDRELHRLDDTLIAILTLGGSRPFLVRPRGGGRSCNLAPGSGDLIVMGGACQADWEHGVPKVAIAGPRISATWRWSPAVKPEVRAA